MSESQPDMLGGKAREARSLPRVRRGSIAKAAPAGHADKPGTGPAGETCAGCHWLTTFHFRHTYQKCGARAGDTWKGGRATDVRPMDAACSKFQRLANRLPAMVMREVEELGPTDVTIVETIPPPSGRPILNGPPATVTAATPEEAIRSLGTGSHRVGGFDILIAPAVKTPPRKREEDDDRQISLFD